MSLEPSKTVIRKRILSNHCANTTYEALDFIRYGLLLSLAIDIYYCSDEDLLK